MPPTPSIAFPTISCGLFGYPQPKPAGIAVRERLVALANRPGQDSAILIAVGAAKHIIRDSGPSTPNATAAPPSRSA